jgi:hypothetical protein
MAPRRQNIQELMYVKNGVSQHVYVGWYIDCKNLHSTNTIKFHMCVFHNTWHTCIWLTGKVCLSYWCVSGQCLWGTSVFQTHYSYKAYDGNYKHINHLYFLHIMTLHSLSCISHTNKRKVMKNSVLEGNTWCEAWGSHNGGVKDSSLLGFHPVSLGELLLMFWSIKEPSTSRLLTLDDKPPSSFKMSGTAHPVTQYNGCQFQ